MTQFRQITTARREIRREEKRQLAKAIAAQLHRARYQAEMFRIQAEVEKRRWEQEPDPAEFGEITIN